MEGREGRSGGGKKFGRERSGEGKGREGGKESRVEGRDGGKKEGKEISRKGRIENWREGEKNEEGREGMVGVR